VLRLGRLLALTSGSAAVRHLNPTPSVQRFCGPPGNTGPAPRLGHASKSTRPAQISAPPTRRPCLGPPPTAEGPPAPTAQAPPLTGRSCARPAPSGPAGRWRCCSCAAVFGPRRDTDVRPRAGRCGSGGRDSRRHSPGSTRTGLPGNRGTWGSLDPHVVSSPSHSQTPNPAWVPSQHPRHLLPGGPRTAQLLQPPALPPP
jgi:hypothetical protein